LPEGKYTLTADIWRSGSGGDVRIYAKVGDAARITATPPSNQNYWQEASLSFETDGETAVRIGLENNHTVDANEKFGGFDNFRFVYTPTAVDVVRSEDDSADPSAGATYDLSGRRVSADKPGIYIRDGKKFVISD
jgi:hypothetical protein